MAGPVRTPEFDSATIRRIAVAANADPRTVVRFVMGQPVAGVCAERIAPLIERLRETHIATEFLRVGRGQAL